MSVNWPTRMDYANAIQNPKNCFKCSTLKNSMVKTNSLGLPIGASGAYAIVFELKAGKQRQAVRCFTQPIKNQDKRYKTLSRFLKGTNIDSLVDFEYLAEGIKVNGYWYPILKMEWISGKLLSEYIRTNLKRKKKLSQLVEEWKNVLSDLNKAGIAHGDLQHGNIIVQSEGKIRLVDYDSFFIPSLRNNAPDEVGHSNYQHPERIKTGCYDENIDSFPALVIYLSLIALLDNSQLWKKFNDGGDNLIFSANDLKNPGKTPVWKELQKTSDVEVLKLTDKLKSFCREPVANIPKLDIVLDEKPVITPFQFNISPRPKAANPVKPQPHKKPPLPKPRFNFWMQQPISRPVLAKNKCICGYVNRNDEIYCQKCARTLLTGNSWCYACETPVPRRVKFCTRCGTQQ